MMVAVGPTSLCLVAEAPVLCTAALSGEATTSLRLTLLRVVLIVNLDLLGGVTAAGDGHGPLLPRQI